LIVVKQSSISPGIKVVTKCFHCGQECHEQLVLDEKIFCCQGCKTVYEILNANDLCNYYALDESPGVTRSRAAQTDFLYLDEVAVRDKVLSFDSKDFARVSFFTPDIHCVSCVWLLENLQKIEKGITKSEVNFGKRSVTIDFNPAEVKLSRIATLLSSVGYTPQIYLDAAEKKINKTDRKLLIKLSIAGFCFGNVMLFSFPEYLGLDHHDAYLMRLFSFLNLALSVPVFFYSGFDYLRSAVQSFRQKQINIEVPIAAGLIALFLRSGYDIISATGPGYLDSFTGLVFFLLIGRWFQSKTYETMAFDRDFRSYFPLAVYRKTNNQWQPVIINELQRGDEIRIRNLEIIPADGNLLADRALIDYSFVTGESRPVRIQKGEKVYAGGRLMGEPITLVVDKRTSQSHLTSLWNNSAFNKVSTGKYQKLIDTSARRFTWIILGIAVITAIYWQMNAPSQMWLVLTSVLMVACPCALALAAPFTYGGMLRVFGRYKFYLKNADVIERLASVDTVVFDKTGTVTHGDKPEITFHGTMSREQFEAVKVLTAASTHPLSGLITNAIEGSPLLAISEFSELPGKGIKGVIGGKIYRVGSAAFASADPVNKFFTSVFVSCDGVVLGYFSIRIMLRSNIGSMLRRLGSKCAALLSGDNDADKNEMENVFHASSDLLFNQTPHDKLAYIGSLQQKGKTVLMVGDGLNDSGALKQSDVGVAVTDDTSVFTPACDGILQGDKLQLLDRFMLLAKRSTIILKSAFAISFFYNAIALGFAVTGHLTPLVAAVLMPLSSVSVVGFSTIAVNLTAKRIMNVKQI
jgi:Cu+-exporting ATPase